VCGYAEAAGPCTQVNAFLYRLGLKPEFFATLNAFSVLLAALPCLSVAALLFVHARGRRNRLLFAYFMAAAWMSDMTAIDLAGTLGWWLPTLAPLGERVAQMALGVSHGLAGALIFGMAGTFPNGRWMPRWLRWVGWVWGGLLLLSGMAGNTANLSTVFDYSHWPVLGAALPAFASLLAVLSLAYRYRRAGTTRRAQLRWVLPPAALLAGVYLLGAGLDQWLTQAGGAHEDTVLHFVFWINHNVLQAGCAALAALAIGAAVLRRQLFGLTVVQRGLFYVALAALALALHVFLLGVLGLAAGAVLGARLSAAPAWLSAATVGLAALLLQPLRRPLERTIRALVYGGQDEAESDAALRLTRSLGLAPEPSALRQTLVDGLWRVLPLTYAALALVEDHGLEQVALARGAPSDGALEVPLITQGRRVGSLRVASARPLESHERRWLWELALHAGTAVQAAQSTLALQQAEAALTASLASERPRIQRELHDGLGPALASLVLSLDSLRKRAETSRLTPEQALAGLEGIKSDAREIVDEIQTLVSQLRPPVLDQVGLVQAVRYFAANCADGMELRVEAPFALPPLPAAVEHAAYRIACEAITNTLHHANAHLCQIALAATLHELYLAISDDGIGAETPDPAPGLGLASMRARAEELSGSFKVSSPPGGGTQIQVWLPLAAAFEATHVV
jgi:signal transduction histidine kinase